MQHLVIEAHALSNLPRRVVEFPLWRAGTCRRQAIEDHLPLSRRRQRILSCEIQDAAAIKRALLRRPE